MGDDRWCDCGHPSWCGRGLYVVTSTRPAFELRLLPNTNTKAAITSPFRSCALYTHGGCPRSLGHAGQDEWCVSVLHNGVPMKLILKATTHAAENTFKRFFTPDSVKVCQHASKSSKFGRAKRKLVLPEADAQTDLRTAQAILHGKKSQFISICSENVRARSKRRSLLTWASNMYQLCRP